jgi:competence protein ComEA
VPAAEATLPVAAPSATAPASTLPVTASTPPSPTDAAGDASIVVHVAGAVRSPGVYELMAPTRVHDAIERAGGAVGDADLDALNLAQGLADGQRLYVPTTDERGLDAETYVTPEQPAQPAPDGSHPGSVSTIDLNRATAAELETLPGIGPSTARAIVEDRDRNGPFATVDDLDRVSGIGPSKLAALRDFVEV